MSWSWKLYHFQRSDLVEFMSFEMKTWCTVRVKRKNLLQDFNLTNKIARVETIKSQSLASKIISSPSINLTLSRKSSQPSILFTNRGNWSAYNSDPISSTRLETCKFNKQQNIFLWLLNILFQIAISKPDLSVNRIKVFLMIFKSWRN